MNLFNKIFSKNQTPIIDSTNKIIFSVSANGNVKFDILADNIDKKDAKILGNFFYNLNSGVYTSIMLDGLLFMKKHSSYKNNEFIEDIVTEWSMQFNKNTINNNDPIIKPSEFSNESKHQ